MNARTTIRRLAVVAALPGCASAGCASAGSAPAGSPAAPAADDARPTVVILVRHAEKAATAGNDPDLTPIGRRRADDLALALRNARVDAVVVTERRRTHQTAAPIAGPRGLVPDTVALGATVAEHASAVARRIREHHAGETILVVGHSNTIPPIIAALGGPAFPEICDPIHSGLYVLILRRQGPPQLIESRYGAPDPASADSCPGMQAR